MKRIFRQLFGSGEPTCRQASPQDARSIAALHGLSFQRGWSEDEVERLLLDRSVLGHRITRGRDFAGFILSRLATDEAEILSVAVAPKQRGHGLGRTLLRLHLGRLAGLGVRAVFLEVGANNKVALRLYERAGFREVGRRKGYYQMAADHNATALVLRRELD